MSPIIDLQILEQKIRIEIPISNAMRVKVQAATLDRAELEAPLEPNINHEGTAFGGSVSSLALLACWTLVNVNLSSLPDLEFDYVVVQDSQMNYIRPIDSDFSAIASASSGTALAIFLKTLKKHGRARVSLTAEVSSKTGVCASLEARFVAQVRPS